MVNSNAHARNDSRLLLLGLPRRYKRQEIRFNRRTAARWFLRFFIIDCTILLAVFVLPILQWFRVSLEISAKTSNVINHFDF